MKFKLLNSLLFCALFIFTVSVNAQVMNPISNPITNPISYPVNPMPSLSPAINPPPVNPLPMPSIFPGCTLSSSTVDLPPKTNYICGGFCGLNMNIPCLFDASAGTCGANCPRSIIDEFWPSESPSPFNPYDHINHTEPSPTTISY